MPKIKQLSHHEAQKIAAGEVIERPANIVKELIENSIDAGAKIISVYIEDGGKSLIRIVDNGCGMEKEDALLCFNRHATSKITQVSDLESISTFGFRGEALASIASVSKITLITKEEHTLEGNQVVVNGGTIDDINIIACATGTDITISDLFFNVPARKKFLKSTETEWRSIQGLFNAFCFDYTDIRFTLFNNNKQVSQHPAVESLKDRTVQMWQPTSNHHFLSVENDDTAYVIKGVISDHQYYRYDKSNMYFFVNKRWIKNYQLSNALIKGYANVIPEGRYPSAVIHINVPAHEVDINIHPRKEEVKFLHPRRIEQMLQQVVKTSLENNLSRHLKKEVTLQPAVTPQYHHYQPINFTPFNFDAVFLPTEADKSNYNMQAAPMLENVPNAQDSNVKVYANQSLNLLNVHEEQKINFRLIGQYNTTYILIEKEEGLFLIDQHAAHERILYEQFANKLNNIATVPLLFPHIVTLSANDITILLPYFELFNSYGIVIEQCSIEQLMVQSLPVHLKNHSLDDLIKETISWIIEYKTLEKEELKKTINNKLQAQMACKAAVKAGDELSTEKMLQLLNDLEKTANRLTCPHGRPTGWLISLSDIEKKFKRKL